MKAIDTIYNGYRFRSRLEARWAVFLDNLEIPYQYEPEGYDLGAAGLYLPDFRLPSLDAWMEIKAQSPTDEEVRKAAALAELTNQRVFIFHGDIQIPNDDCDSAPKAEMLDGIDGGDTNHMWCECLKCGAVGIQFDGRSDRLPCKKVTCMDSISYHGDKGYCYNGPRLVRAFTAARMARFEHGEQG